jgi:hypothetical protein
VVAIALARPHSASIKWSLSGLCSLRGEDIIFLQSVTLNFGDLRSSFCLADPCLSAHTHLFALAHSFTYARLSAHARFSAHARLPCALYTRAHLSVVCARRTLAYLFPSFLCPPLLVLSHLRPLVLPLACLRSPTSWLFVAPCIDCSYACIRVCPGPV